MQIRYFAIVALSLVMSACNKGTLPAKPVLKVTLLPGWMDISDQNPNGPPTYIRKDNGSPGVLQFSLDLYEAGEKPAPSKDGLIKMAINTGLEHPDFGEVVSDSSGSCSFGIYGSAVFSSAKYGRSQVWWLSNGLDFILATHIGVDKSSDIEIQEEQQIVENVTTQVKTKPWWKKW